MTRTYSGSGMCSIIDGAVVVKRRHLCSAHPAMYNFYSKAVRFNSYPVSDRLTIAITLVSPLYYWVMIANPVSWPTDTYTCMGAYGSAVANVSRSSIQRKIVLRAAVHSNVHSPSPLGDSSPSMGLTSSLKFGTNGEAHNNLPSVYCNSCSVVGSSVPTQFFRLFFAKRYEPLHTSTPTIVTLGCRNWHLRRFIINPAYVSALSVAQVSRQFRSQQVPGICTSS
jgi:hypothetical protein